MQRQPNLHPLYYQPLKNDNSSEVTDTKASRFASSNYDLIESKIRTPDFVRALFAELLLL